MPRTEIRVVGKGELSHVERETQRLRGRIDELRTATQKQIEVARETREEMGKLTVASDQLGGGMSRAKALTDELSNVLGVKLTPGFLATGGAAMGVVAILALLGKAAFNVGKQYDAAMDSMLIHTGATDRALAGLKDSLNAVLRDVPVGAEAAAGAIGALNSRLDLTGPGLEEMATQILNVSRLLELDATKNAELFSRVIGDWSIPVDEASLAMDQLFVVSQQTGVGLDNLMQKVVQFGVPLRQMGFEFEEAIALIGKFEAEGVNAELVFSSLRIASIHFARAQQEPQQALRETIAAIQAATEQEAIYIAAQVFGARAGSDMAGAIREGRFAYEDLLPALEAADGAVQRMADNTDDAAEKWRILGNRIKEAIEPIGTAMVDGLTDVSDRLIYATDRAREHRLSLEEQKRWLALTSRDIGEYAVRLGEAGLLNRTAAAYLSQNTSALLDNEMAYAVLHPRMRRVIEDYFEFTAMTRTGTPELAAHERALAMNADAQRRFGIAVEETNPGLEEQKLTLEELAQAVLDGTATLAEYEAEQQANMTAVQRLNAAIREQDQAQRELERSQREQIKLHQDLTRIAGDLAQGYDYVGRSFSRVVEATGPAVDLYDNLTSQQERLVGQAFALGVQLEAGVITNEDYDEALGKVTEQTAALAAQQAVLGDSLGSTVEWYTAANLSLEDQQAVGQGILKIFELYGQGLEMQGEQLDDYMLRWGMVTQQQLTYRGVVESVMEAVGNGNITLRDAEDILGGYTTGLFNSVDAVQAAINKAEEEEDLRQRVVDKTNEMIDRYSVAGTTAQDSATEQETAADRQIAALGEVETALTDAQTTAEDAMSNVSLAMDRSIPAINRAKLAVNLLGDALIRAKNNSNINISVTGDGIPGGAGGADFVTSGPMLLMVGDNPGGRERVQVTPLSGRGVTRGIPGGAAMAGGGTALVGGAALGGGTLVLNANFYGMVDESTVARTFDMLEREAGRRGYALATPA